MFAYTSPNCSGVDAIDNPDQFEQVFETYYIPEVSEKIFMDDISMVRPYRLYFFGGYKAFNSKILLTITSTKGDSM